MSDTGVPEIDFDDQLVGEAPNEEILLPGVDPPTVADDPIGGGEAPPVGGSEEKSPEELSEYGSQFLEHVPEADRATVAKYLSPWDAGAQRKFKEYQGTIDGWEELGGREEIERGKFLLNQLRNNPDEFYRNLGDQIGTAAPPTQQPYQQPGVAPDINQQAAAALGVPPELASQISPEIAQSFQMINGMMDRKYADRLAEQDRTIKQMQSALGEVGGQLQQRTEQDEQRIRHEKVNEDMSLLERQYGAFDRDYVLGQVAAGMHPEDAVKNYQAFRQGILNEQAQKPALPGPTLGSSGHPPAEQAPDFTELSAKQTRKLVADILSQANQESE